MKKTMSTEDLVKFFSEKGVNLEHLAVLTSGSDSIIGEVNVDGDEAIQSAVLVTNPKRLFRFTQVQTGGLVINYMVGDWDFMEEGSIWVAPTMCYHVMEQPDDTINMILSLMKEHLDRKVLNKAEQAGLVLPSSPVQSPFRKKENGG